MVSGNVLSGLKDKYLSKYREEPLLTVFLTIMFIGILYTVIISLIWPPFFESTIGKMEQHVFMDYFWSVRDSIGEPYTEAHVIYPALITLIYRFIGNATYPMTDITTGDIAIDMYNSQIPMLVFIFLTIFALYLLHVLVHRKLDGVFSNNKIELIFFCLLFSFPIIFAITNGNCIIYTLIFCLLFLFGYRSENRYVRYISYACLGIAAGMKLTPAIFALLILREREWKEFFVCVIIVAAFVFIPFLFINGSFTDMVQAIFNNTDTLGGSVNTIKKMFWSLSESTGMSIFNDIGTVVIAIVSVITFLIVAFDRKIKIWESMILIAGYLTVGLGVGTPYLYIYFIIPLLYFLVMESKGTRRNLIYIIFMAFMLMFITVDSSPTKSICIMLVMLFIFYESCVRLRNSRKQDMVTDCT